MKIEFAIRIIRLVLDSLKSDERLTETQINLLSRIIDDMIYDKKIRINHYLENYSSCFEELKKELREI